VSIHQLGLSRLRQAASSRPTPAFVLQTAGPASVSDPGHPNCIAPGKRAAPNTTCPGDGDEGRRAVMPYGVMGPAIPAFGHTHLLTNILRLRLATFRKRSISRASFTQAESCRSSAACRRSPPSGLPRRGHRVEPSPEPVRRRPGDLDRLAERRAHRRLRTAAWMAARWAFKCLPRQVDARRNALRNMS